MIRNSDYIYKNILIADNKNTTLQYCKKTTGVDLSVKNLYNISTPGAILHSGTIVGEYRQINKSNIEVGGTVYKGWYLPQGSYICELNEGCIFGSSDVGYIFPRSSLNRNGVSLISAVWDPGFTTKNEKGDVYPMSVRITVDAIRGVYVEENARVAQLLVFRADKDSLQYGLDGHQFQGKGLF